jgi:hypothetical protein
MANDPHRLVLWSAVAAVLFAAGFLVAVRQRSRRAATLGLAGVALLGVSMASAITGYDYYQWLAELLAGPDRARMHTVASWFRSLNLATANALLVWAVLTDRPPPAEEDLPPSDRFSRGDPL